jgi:hypothetical protein
MGKKIAPLGIKNTCGSGFPTNPIFFYRPYYFLNAIDSATLFSLGGCGRSYSQNGVCCHNNY